MMTVLLALIWNVNAEGNLTLDQIKRYAIEHNYGLKGLHSELEEARAQNVQARATFFPKFSVISGPEIAIDGVKNRSEPLAYVEGRWNLFRGSGDRLNLEVSRWNEAISESALRQGEFELGIEVEDLFFAHIATSSKYRNYGQALEINEKHRQMMRKRQASGMASQADIMEFELRDSYLRSEMKAIEQERQEAKIGLVRLMGADSFDFEPFGALPHAHLSQSRQVFLKRISETSEQVRMASFRAVGAELGHKQARSAWFPTIDLETRYGRLPLELSQEAPSFQGTLLLKWEFFSGFETTGKVAEAAARAARRDSEYRQKLLSTMSDAEVSYSRLKSLEDRIHVEEGNEAKAGVYYRAVLDEYRRGLKNGADLRMAEDLLLQAKGRALDLRYRFVTDKLRLQRAIGFVIETKAHEEG